jgi:hypothetical protein
MIDASLNFVFPCYHGEDIYAYVHTRPISAAAFDMSYRLLIRVYNTTLGEGPIAVRFMDKFLRDAAKEMSNGGDDLSVPLMNELGRTSSVILATKDGWQTLPLQQALDGKLLDPEDASSAVNAALFFSVGWHIHPKKAQTGLFQTGAEHWEWQSTSSSPTEWIASLPTSTGSVSSEPRGAPAQPASFVINGLARAS